MIRTLAHVAIYIAITLLAGCGASGWKVAAITVASIDRSAPAAVREWGAINIAKEKAIVDTGIAAGRSKDVIMADVGAWRRLADSVSLGFTALLDSTGVAKDVILAKGKPSAILAPIVAAVLDLVARLRAAGVALPATIANLVSLLGGG